MLKSTVWLKRPSSTTWTVVISTAGSADITAIFSPLPITASTAPPSKSAYRGRTAPDHKLPQEEPSHRSCGTLVEHLNNAAPFKILCIQTDNGAEFTKKFVSDDANPHLFGEKLKEFGIRHKLIKPFTPRHNGKVERSHRKDNEYFYASHKFYSFLDFQKQLAVHCRRYDRFPIWPLGWLDPLAFLAEYRNRPSAPTV